MQIPGELAGRVDLDPSDPGHHPVCRLLPEPDLALLLSAMAGSRSPRPLLHKRPCVCSLPSASRFPHRCLSGNLQCSSTVVSARCSAVHTLPSGGASLTLDEEGCHSGGWRWTHILAVNYGCPVHNGLAVPVQDLQVECLVASLVTCCILFPRRGPVAGSDPAPLPTGGGGQSPPAEPR